MPHYIRALRQPVTCVSLVFCWVTTASGQAHRIDLPSNYVAGYQRAVRGEELQYHSPLPSVDRSLLVRSLDRERWIEWETAPVPAGYSLDTAVFVLMAGIDVSDEPRRFDLFLNDRLLLNLENPQTSELGSISWLGREGVHAEFRVTVIDRYGDAMGYIFLSVPRALWEEGRSVRVRVAGESAGRRTWFMVFKEGITPHVALRNAPALLRNRSGNQQAVRLDLGHLGEPARFHVESSLGSIDTIVSLGLTRFQLPVPEVERSTPVVLELELNGYRTVETSALEPVQRMDLYLIHHTHLDIGYTHQQDEVERLQWQHLERALEYGKSSEDYPAGARFVWNPEGLWAVESYLEKHGSAERERLLEGVRRGWIALDGMFANLLTGIASSEGLMRSMETSRRLSQRAGVTIESAMLSDIPGFTWGLVPVLAHHGIQYLSIGPNFGHRVGHFLDTWGDRPFYWESPSGQERVLTWVSGAGYAWFHSGLGYSRITKALDEESVFKYVDQLVAGQYPYDMAYMRYNIGSDNGPPDPNLAEAVRTWNEKYVSPRLIISSTADVFRTFESAYGDRLPVYRGDLTGHWEDGAASSARETALARRTAESLVQSEALAAILGTELPREDVYRAWRQVVLFYEHTWGSWNSISEPESEFTQSQWRHKRDFADSAAAMAGRLRALAIADRIDASPRPAVIEVINTSSWMRSDVVVIPAEQSARGDVVLDEAGIPVPSQRLGSGELAFRADNVPGFGARRYRLMEGAAETANRHPGEPNVVSNGSLRVEMDSLTGTIRSLTYEGRELVDADRGAGLNHYVYVAGRDPGDAVSSGPVRSHRKERGPLVFSIEARSTAPGTRAGLRREVRVYDGIDRVDIVNRFDKEQIYEPEALLFAFPFRVEDPQVRIDVPWGSFLAESDQLPGSCKNYLSLQRWVDIYNREWGITVASIDAPLIQLGAIRTDAVVVGWDEHIQPTARLFSYTMNNYWETNYRAAQSGHHQFMYSLRPHGIFSESKTERFAVEMAQPLVAIPVKPGAREVRAPFEVEATHVVVTLLKQADDGDGLVVRLYNPGEQRESVRLLLPPGAEAVVTLSDVWERVGAVVAGRIELGPYELVTLRVRS